MELRIHPAEVPDAYAGRLAGLMAEAGIRRLLQAKPEAPERDA